MDQPTPAPDAAVQIAANAICPGEAEYYYDDGRKVVAALAREYEFCPPGTMAEVERLRAALAAETKRRREVDVVAAERAFEVVELRAALDAAAEVQK